MRADQAVIVELLAIQTAAVRPPAARAHLRATRGGEKPLGLDVVEDEVPRLIGRIRLIRACPAFAHRARIGESKSQLLRRWAASRQATRVAERCALRNAPSVPSLPFFASKLVRDHLLFSRESRKQ